MSAIAYPPYRQYLVDRARTASAGGPVTSWHQRNPVEVCPRGEFYECAKKSMTAATLHSVLTPGTPENALWRADVDAFADVLRELRDRGVVVLFRPYHEFNGNWFWWGQQDEYPALWDALYDELVVNRGIDNLIWVWSGDRDAPQASRYMPRRHPPDIAGIDVYEENPDSAKYSAGRASVTHAALAVRSQQVGWPPSAAYWMQSTQRGY